MTASIQSVALDERGAAAFERDRLLAARYGEAVSLAGGSWNGVLATLLDHRSVRSFSSKALPAGTLELLVAAAQSAPTSSNTQSWSVVSVVDRAKRERLAGIAGDQRHIVDAPLFLVWIADLARAAAIGRAGGVELGGLDYTEAFLVAAIDAALAAQNALIAAESLGFGTVYIGALRNGRMRSPSSWACRPAPSRCSGSASATSGPARPPR